MVVLLHFTEALMVAVEGQAVIQDPRSYEGIEVWVSLEVGLLKAESGENPFSYSTWCYLLN